MILSVLFYLSSHLVLLQIDPSFIFPRSILSLLGVVGRYLCEKYQMQWLNCGHDDSGQQSLGHACEFVRSSEDESQDLLEFPYFWKIGTCLILLLLVELQKVVLVCLFCSRHLETRVSSGDRKGHLWLFHSFFSATAVREAIL